jgi:hypothetical protein
MRQLAPDNAQEKQNCNFISAAYFAAAGHAVGQAKLNAIRLATPRDPSIFEVTSTISFFLRPSKQGRFFLSKPWHLA